MANAALLKANMPVRALIQGRPKTGKTGALAILADHGFKLRILDFDANPEPLLQFTSTAGLENMDIIQLQDKMRDSNSAVGPSGKPEAFTEGLKMLTEWSYKNSDGTVTNLGKSKDWGPDTIVVIDSLTSMGDAAKSRAMSKLNKTRENSNWRVWGFAQQDIQNTIKLLKNPDYRYHLIVLSHPKMIGPDPLNEDKNLTEAEQQNNAILAARASVIPTRLYPSTPGKALSPTIGAELPIILRSDVGEYRGRIRNIFTAEPGYDTDTGAPVKLPDNIKWPLPAETALLDLFKAMGAYPIR